MDIKEKISTWVDSREERLIADISRLVAIKSVGGEARDGAPFGEGPKAALEEAVKICGEHGFITINCDNYVMTADINYKETVVDILAHLDVVGEGEGWETPPYQPAIRDGCLYGRGTDDDKGPAVECIYAMECVRDICAELGIEMKKNARLILGTDEETGSRDISYYYARNKAAPNTFSPDAAFPVINVEKGFYRPMFTKKWGLETVQPRVKAFNGGYRLNVIPADAKAVVCGLDIRAVNDICSPLADKLGVKFMLTQLTDGVEIAVSGRSAHASMPPLSNNGLTALLELLCVLPLAECESTIALRQLNSLFPHNDAEGIHAGIAMEDRISHKLTLAFTLMELDGSGVSGWFDARVPLCANEDNCKNVMEAKFKSLGFDVRGDMLPPHHTPEDRPFIKTLLKCYEQYTGLKGECQSMGGGTYVHDVEGGVAFGATMPGFESNLHGANERLNIKDMLTACKIFAQVIYDMCV